MMDKFTIIRSLYGCQDQHTSDLCLSGYPIGPRGRQDGHQLGIDVGSVTIPDAAGRPHYLLERREPIKEFIADQAHKKCFAFTQATGTFR